MHKTKLENLSQLVSRDHLMKADAEASTEAFETCKLKQIIIERGSIFSSWCFQHYPNKQDF